MRKKINELATSSILLALCAVLPLLFHMIPNAGSMFSPLHIPILICAFVCSLKFGILVALSGPLVCLCFTGSPQVPNLFWIMIECLSYVLIIYFVNKLCKFKNKYWQTLFCLIIAILIGRFVGGAFSTLFLGEGLNLYAFISTYYILGLPGIIIQIIVIPIIVVCLFHLQAKGEKENKNYIDYEE